MATYSVDELFGKLERADAAGDTEAAKVIADEIRRVQGAAKPDFSNVEATSDTMPGLAAEPPKAPEQPGYWDQRMQELRDFAGQHGARQVLQGIGGTLDMLGGHAFSQFVERPLGLSQGESYREKMASIADSAGFQKPQTAQQRIVSDVGEALTGAGLTMGIGSGLSALANTARSGSSPIMSRLGQFLTAQPGLQAVSTATGAGAAGAARESGATGGQQALAGLVGGLAPGITGATTAATLRGLVRGGSGENMLQRIQDFASIGASPSVGQASGNRALQGAENLLAGGPTSAGVMERFAERQADDIGSGIQALAERVSRNPSAERAGRAIERGVETFGQNINATKRALYWQADRFIPETTAVPLSNTWQTIDRLTTPTQGATATTAALINPRIAQLRQTLAQDLAAGGGTIPYEALKRIRTDIGETITDFSLSLDTPTRELRQLYAALSRDMEAAAQAMGPDAVRAAKRANTFTRTAADRLEQIQRVVDKNGGPEKVFTAAMSGTRDGGTTLRAVMQSLPKEGQKALTAAVIKRMGLANPGGQDAAGDVFSAATFLTNWNKVSPEAKRALFDRYGPEFSRDMDRVARVAQNIKDGSKVFANPSGTANRGAAIGYWVSLLGALATGNPQVAGGLAAGGTVANAAARFMTTPWAVRWLANSTALPVGSVVSQAQALRQIAERNNDQEMVEIASVLEEQARNQQGNGNSSQQ